MTIAQTIFARVKEEFARGNTKLSKSEIIGWDITYEEGGQTKHANGDTRARKLRLLVEANYLGRVEEGGMAYIVPATGQTRPIQEDTDEESQEEAGKRYRYEPIFLEGKPTGRVRQIEITE